MADVAITANNVKASGQGLVKKYLAQGVLARGLPVVYSQSAGGYIQAKANALSGAPVEGISLQDIGPGQYFLFCASDVLFTPGFNLASGQTVWVSATGITITAADLVSGWNNVVLGVGIGNNQMILRPLNGGLIP